MNAHLKTGLKVFIIGLMLVQVLYPHVAKKTIPDLHGAYVVEKVLSSGEMLERLDFPVKRVFFHKDNFIIFQNINDEMIDYHYEISAARRMLILSDYKGNTTVVSYRMESDLLILNFEKRNLQITAKALPWKELPALQNDFHFTIDALIKPDSIPK